MEIIVRGHHMTVPARFRQHATEKLAKLAKLDQKAMRIDVEVSKERNSRQADRRERVELTIRSRGPAIRAEAAAEDRYTALDMAFAKLENRLRRVSDRRKVKHGDNASVRSPGMLTTVVTSPADAEGMLVDMPALTALEEAEPPSSSGNGHADPDGRLVPIQMEGDGPLVVREKTHPAKPMTIDQALLEMELVGHDFYLFHDSDCDRFSVVYRRRGYDYGVIRLVEE
ncbi:MAG TPA: ribosome-associated translation inhibitor RaiA [Streptosporangiaceae bacterium]|nr:ribosome-associated translation inhibitor RaiA [Streptosporangiaceae bacterium]